VLGKWKRHVTPKAKKNEIKHPSKEVRKTSPRKLGSKRTKESRREQESAEYSSNGASSIETRRGSMVP